MKKEQKILELPSGLYLHSTEEALALVPILAIVTST